jgi:hypothetical protein
VRPYRFTMTFVAVLVLTCAVQVGAQQPDSSPPAQPAPAAPQPIAPAVAQPIQPGSARPSRPLIPLEVQLVISRYQGEKRTSSMPYVLAVNANGGNAQLNMGADVAVPTTAFVPAGDGKTPAPAPLRSFNYRNIGTNIVCAATTGADDGRFDLNISVDDSSVFTKDDAANSTENLAFRSFKSRNTLLLRDGQTRQYTAATDRVSGETIRIEVTLKVVK